VCDLHGSVVAPVKRRGKDLGAVGSAPAGVDAARGVV